MNKASAISSWQLAVLLFLSRMLQFFLAPPQKDAAGAISAALILPLSMAAAALLILPGMRLLGRHKGQSLLDLGYESWGKLGAAVPVGFFLFSLLVLCQTAGAFSDFLVTAAYPETSPWLFILLTMAVGGYAAAMGYEPTARFGFFVLLAFGSLFILSGFFLWPQAQWEYLRPASYDSLPKLMDLFCAFTLGNLETAVLFFLLPAVAEGKGKVFWRWNLLVLAALEGMILVSAAVLGDYAKSQPYPFYIAAQIAEGSVFQRLDSLHMALWVFVAVIRLALFLEVGGKSLARLLPQKGKKYAVSICSAAAAVLAGFLVQTPDGVARLGRFLSGGVPVILLVLLLPLILWLSPKKGGVSR